MPNPFRLDFAGSPTVVTGTKTLDGRVYRFKFWPNTRADDGRGAYYVDLYNVLGAAVVLGVKMIVTDDLFAPFRETVVDVPPGRVVIRRTDGLTDDPAIYDLAVPSEPKLLLSLGSANVVLEYLTVAEVAAA